MRLGAGALSLLLALALLAGGALCAAVAVGLSGYRALTREELAATVHTAPIGPQTFEARIVLPDGSEANYRLAGDQFAIEARILKWHPWANLLGLHTAYELDRVTGRYVNIEDEQQRPRTVFPLAPEHRLDLFAWRARLPWLAPVVDAEYGSSTFTRADRVAHLRGARLDDRAAGARDSRPGEVNAAPTRPPRVDSLAPDFYSGRPSFPFRAPTLRASEAFPWRSSSCAARSA